MVLSTRVVGHYFLGPFGDQNCTSAKPRHAHQRLHDEYCLCTAKLFPCVGRIVRRGRLTHLPQRWIGSPKLATENGPNAGMPSRADQRAAEVRLTSTTKKTPGAKAAWRFSFEAVFIHSNFCCYRSTKWCHSGGCCFLTFCPALHMVVLLGDASTAGLRRYSQYCCRAMLMPAPLAQIKITAHSHFVEMARGVKKK